MKRDSVKTELDGAMDGTPSRRKPLGDLHGPNGRHDVIDEARATLLEGLGSKVVLPPPVSPPGHALHPEWTAVLDVANFIFYLWAAVKFRGGSWMCALSRQLAAVQAVVSAAVVLLILIDRKGRRFARLTFALEVFEMLILMNYLGPLMRQCSTVFFCMPGQDEASCEMARHWNLVFFSRLGPLVSPPCIAGIPLAVLSYVPPDDAAPFAFPSQVTQWPLKLYIPFIGLSATLSVIDYCRRAVQQGYFSTRYVGATFFHAGVSFVVLSGLGAIFQRKPSKRQHPIFK